MQRLRADAIMSDPRRAPEVTRTGRVDAADSPEPRVSEARIVVNSAHPGRAARMTEGARRRRSPDTIMGRRVERGTRGDVLEVVVMASVDPRRMPQTYRPGHAVPPGVTGPAERI